MVEEQEEDGALRACPEQGEAEERSACEVEGAVDLGKEALLHDRESLLVRAEVLDGEDALGNFEERGRGLSIPGSDDQPQGTVACDEESKRALERIRGDRPFQLEHIVDVVGGGVGVELVQEPHPLLRV